MSLLKHNCDPELLQQSLSEQLSEQAEERLIAHLDECQNCRQQLETLAGAPKDWSTIEQALKEERYADTVHWSAISDSPTPVPADFAVDFLLPSSQADSIGRLDDIEIHSVIGHGGNGIVLKGYQPELKRLVAVKVMAPTLAASAAARQRFAREAQATAAVVHPNVMPILTVHSEGPLPYLVMPFVDCESLQQRVDEVGSLSVLDVLGIAHQVASGLAAAHAQGLVHRDVKPANILLEKRINRVMLTDFGLARAADDASLTRTGLIAGTPSYMSPEQARGDVVDARSDLFSLGSVMYAMATGRPPFRAETVYGILRRVTDETPRPVHQVNAQIPFWLSALIARFQHANPDERISDSETAAALLQECLAHVQQPAAFELPATVRQMQVEAGRRKLLQQAAPFLKLPYLLIAMLLVAVTVLILKQEPRPAVVDGWGAPATDDSNSSLNQDEDNHAAANALEEAGVVSTGPVRPADSNLGEATTLKDVPIPVISDESASAAAAPAATSMEFTNESKTTADVEYDWSDDVSGDLSDLNLELLIIEHELNDRPAADEDLPNDAIPNSEK